MFGTIIKLLVVFTVCWVIYTQFFGTEQEQEQGQEVIESTKNLAKGIFGIIQHESSKLKEGAYDEKIDELGSLLNKLKSQSNDNGQKEELDVLLEEKTRIEEEISKSKEVGGEETATDVKTKEDLKKLAENVQKVVEAMED